MLYVRKLYALFVDLSKAFDSVRHEKCIQTVQAMYKNAKAKIRTVSGEICYFCMNHGVLQGKTLSPKLFSLFIEDIVEILNQSNISSVKVGKADLHILLYANDMVLLAYNLFDLEEKINSLRRFFMENDLQVLWQVTLIIHFATRCLRLKVAIVPTFLLKV
jgi:hypothetical protein